MKKQKNTKRPRVPVRFPADGLLWLRLQRVVFGINERRDLGDPKISINDYCLMAIERQVSMSERHAKKTSLNIQEG